MDLIKQMVANRIERGVTTTKPEQKSKPMVPIGQKPKTFKQRRKEIIDNQPKAKVVKEYFEDLIQALANDSSSDEEM